MTHLELVKALSVAGLWDRTLALLSELHTTKRVSDRMYSTMLAETARPLSCTCLRLSMRPLATSAL